MTDQKPAPVRHPMSAAHAAGRGFFLLQMTGGKNYPHYRALGESQSIPVIPELDRLAASNAELAEVAMTAVQHYEEMGAMIPGSRLSKEWKDARSALAKVTP